MRRTVLAIFCIFLVCGCQWGKGDLSGDWDEIEARARGSQVRFYMDGKDARANAWFDGYVAEEVRKRFGITLVRVPIGADVVVPKLVAEKGSNRRCGVDLFRVQGADFKTAREGGVLHGPFAQQLPNFVRYVDKQAAAYDFGYPVAGYEVPLGWVQFVFRYASDRLKQPPRTLLELQGWIKANPGRFTYPAPPDPTGSAFIRQLFCTITGGPKRYLSGWSEKLYEDGSSKLWKFLEQLQPDLWRGGQEYPESAAALDKLFEDGAIDIGMRYGPPRGAAGRDGERSGDATRTFVVKGGTLYSMHFLAIPEDSPNKAGAMVVANFLLSPEAQYSKFLPENWGDYPALNPDALDKEQWTRFKEVRLDDSLPPLETLRRASIPDIASEYATALDKGWEANVQ
jgi:putative spermidine/putrescine transport system substrate-binding protein